MVIGKLNNSYIFASETCALDIIGATFLREVENGEIVIIENENLSQSNHFLNKNQDHACLDTYILQDQIASLIKDVLTNTEKI